MHIDDKEEAQYSPLSDQTTQINYPNKPTEPTAKNTWQRSIGSSLLFVLAAYYFLNWELLTIAQIVGVLFIHELGHYWTMKTYKYKDLGILFIPLLGAVATGKKDQYSQKETIRVLFAGPLPGILIGIVLLLMNVIFPSSFLFTLSNIFVFFNLLNLLPVLPLDGGKIIQSLFFGSKLYISTVFTLLSILAVGAYIFYSHSFYLLILLVFLILQLFQPFKIKNVKKVLLQKGFVLDKEFSELTDKEYWTLRDELSSHFKHLQKIIQVGVYQEHTQEQKVIDSITLLLQKDPIQDVSALGKVSYSMLWILSIVIPIVLFVATNSDLLNNLL